MDSIYDFIISLTIIVVLYSGQFYIYCMIWRLIKLMKRFGLSIGSLPHLGIVLMIFLDLLQISELAIRQKIAKNIA